MSEAKFFKLTLELNSKLNNSNVSLMEKYHDIVDAKGKFNRASEGSKHIIILSLAQHSVNLILRLDSHPESKPVGIRTINRFVSVLQDSLNCTAYFSTNAKGIFKVSVVKQLDVAECKTIVNALYTEGNEFFDISDIQKLFVDFDDTESNSLEIDTPKVNSDEVATSSLEEALDKVDRLPGSSEFKNEIRNLVRFVEVKKQLNSSDSPIVFPYHYVFKGNKGIDRRLPARLMAEVLFHLGILKNRRFAVLNVPEEGNEYSGINFECSVEVAETGFVFVEGIFECEDESISPKKVIDKLAEKMNQYKGRIVFVISHTDMEDRGYSNKLLIDSLHGKVNYRQVEFPFFSSDELTGLIEATAASKGCKVSPEAAEAIRKSILEAKDPKPLNIETAVCNILEKAFSDKAFSAVNLSEEVMRELTSLETGDFNFLHTGPASHGIAKDPLNELDAMIGLPDVKNRITQICNVLTVRARKKELGIQTNPVCLHMQFTGGPGTGKTTVARIIGNVMKNLGFLSSGHFVELTRNDLIGEYIGQTTPKVKKALKKARGGIMFIDEAYSLYQGADNDYGSEAVSELLKGMEDFKDDMVVIFAGYPKEMEKMVGMNPGLRDRIAFTIEFPDYSADELSRIFMKMCTDNCYTLTVDARQKIDELIRQLHAGKKENFGNARIIRKLFERVEIFQNCRICSTKAFEKDLMTEISLEDVLKLYEDSEVVKLLKAANTKSNIGFRQCV